MVAHVELEGLESAPYALKQEIRKVEATWNSFVNEVKSIVDKIDDATSKPKNIEFKKVDEKQGDPRTTSDIDPLGEVNEAPFNPKAESNRENNDEKIVNVTEGG